MRLLSAFVTLLFAFGLQAQPICDELNAGFTTSVSGLSVQFTNTTSGAGLQTTYQWAYGDGTTANAPNPSHTYTAAGEYEVCLYAISIYFNGGTPTTCVDTACTTIVIGGGNPCDDLEACFTASQTTGNTVQFTSCSQPGTNTQYFWTFGDGSNGTDGSPTHTYDQAGTYTVCLTAFWNGCEDTFCLPVVEEGGNDPCDELAAGFTWSTSPNGTQFSNGTIGVGQTTTWYWAFGDGTSSTDGQPFHTYAAPGTYEVCLYALTVFNTGSGVLITCADTSCAAVVIEGGADPCDGLSAEFWFGNNGGDPASIFYSASNGNGPNWVWSFGDGAYSYTGPQGTHTYAAAGVYELCLSVWTWNPTTQDTCWETSCQAVTIEGGDPCDQLEACFTTEVIDNNSFYFVNCTTPSTNFQYLWNFGDGTTSGGVNPDHNYTEPGTYEVCLTAYWGNCTDTTCTTITVTGGGTDPCDGLEAGFTWTTSPNGTQFSNGTVGLGFQTNWYWTFGDGGISDDPQPFHTYLEPGVYVACLTAVSIYELSGGDVITCADTTCYDVIIQGGGDPCDGFEACFEATLIDDNSFVFVNCSSPSTSVQYYWTFGDGNVSTNVNAEHSYSEPGTYEVCLTTYWGNCTDTTCTTITVTGGGTDPCDGLEAGFTWTTSPNGTQFSNGTVGLGFQTNWYWTFGDGGISDDAQPFHTYLEPGVYVACLTAVSIYELSGGGVITCADTTCYDVVIEGGGDPCDQLEACFTTMVIDNNSFYFVNCTTPNTNIQYLWNFGDGATSGGVNPDHNYTEPGTYEVCLTAYWGGCTDTTCTTIVVEGPGGCEPFTIDFTATTQGTATIFQATSSVPVVGYIWYFGDGSDQGYGQVITHLYEPPGPYNVCLVAWYWNNATQDTCWAEHCEEVDPFDVGINETSISSVQLYPNPAHSSFIIDGAPSGAGLRVFSAEGRLVLVQRTNGTRTVVDVTTLAPAIYSVEVRTVEGSLWRRIAIE